MLKRAMICLVVLGLAAAASTSASAFSISSDQQIDGAGPQIVGDPGDGTNTVTPSGTTPDWTFDWADKDGDGNNVPVATPGLQLGADKLYSGDSSSRGTLTLDLAGGDITGDDGLAISTSTLTNQSADHLVIRNLGDIATGEIRTGVTTHNKSGGYCHPGNLTIGSETDPAGDIRVERVFTSSHNSGKYAGNRAGQAGHLTIYGSGDVLIEDSTGSPGEIYTASGSGDHDGWTKPGNVKITHDGAFSADRIVSYLGVYSGSKNPADIILDGGSATGDCSIPGGIDNRELSSKYSSSDQGHVDTSNYANVSVGEIEGYAVASSHRRYGSHVDIYDITGDITITGPVDLYAPFNPQKYSGHLELAADGTVTLEAGLDLSKVLFASLSSGSGASSVFGSLDGFDTTTGLTGSGTLDDPFVTDQNLLRAPDGEFVYYEYESGVFNGYLLGSAWKLADLDGNAGAGGILTPEPSPVPEPASLGLVGLALLGRRKRRR